MGQGALDAKAEQFVGGLDALLRTLDNYSARKFSRQLEKSETNIISVFEVFHFVYQFAILQNLNDFVDETDRHVTATLVFETAISVNLPTDGGMNG